MNIVVSARARTEIVAAFTHYREVAGEPVATDFANRVAEAISLVAEHSGIGHRVRDHEGFRVVLLNTYPYRLFYRVHRGQVRILHVRHVARRPWHPR